MPLIAISGTPGTGKTAVCGCLEKKGYTVVYVSRLVKARPGLVSGFDKIRKVAEVDTGKLNRFLKKEYKKYGRSPIVFIDSHFAHLLDVKLCIVLRCSPAVLEKRLGKRRYPKGKVRENIEAEALDLITIESVQLHGKDKVYEIDTTGRSAPATAKTVLKILKKPGSPHRAGKIDWSEEVLKWY
jgi:adenylate kinase